MIVFIVRRLISMLVVLFCVISLTFFLMRVSPGGPFDRERKVSKNIEMKKLAKYKLDGPTGREIGTSIGKTIGFWEKPLGETGSFLEQYTSYLWDVSHGDLRVSTKYLNQSVNEILAQSLPVSFTLGAIAFLIATSIGVPLGALAAVRQNTLVDAGAMFWALLAVSIPTFVTGPLVVLIFALKLKWLPVGGWGGVRELILPCLVLAAPYVAYVARLMRTSMLEVLSQDFIRTARAKGLPERKVIFQHALKVAILPVVSFLGPMAANLLTGSVVVEAVFCIPGAGGFFVNSILNKDTFLLGGVVIVYCTLLVVLNLFVDVLYTWLDRRIQIDG